MVIGVVGSEQIMKLGAVGDVVNVAARVQGLSRECGFDILITDDTYAYTRGAVAAVACGKFKVKGREQPVEVYGVGESRGAENRAAESGPAAGAGHSASD